MANFSVDVYNRCKRMFVEDNKSCSEISRELGDGAPHHNTILRWSKKVDPRTGKTWEDERLDYQHSEYENASPKAMAQKIVDKINGILESEDFVVGRDSDALWKLQKAFEKLVDKKHQLTIMFDMLSDLMVFIKNYYPGLFSDELINAIRQFKNETYKRLTD